MRKFKKSIWLPIALLIYATGMAVYFIPRNHNIGDTEKIIVVGSSYLVIFLLWLVLRAQERRRKRERENKNENK